MVAGRIFIAGCKCEPLGTSPTFSLTKTSKITVPILTWLLSRVWQHVTLAQKSRNKSSIKYASEKQYWSKGFWTMTSPGRLPRTKTPNTKKTSSTHLCHHTYPRLHVSIRSTRAAVPSGGNAQHSRLIISLYYINQSSVNIHPLTPPHFGTTSTQDFFHSSPLLSSILITLSNNICPDHRHTTTGIE